MVTAPAPTLRSMTLRRCHTAELSGPELAAVRSLCDASFDDFADADWTHALGGMHALVDDDERLVGHGSLVLRRLMIDGEWVRCGYVEAVAVDADHRRAGVGAAVMGALEELAAGYDLLALSASSDAVGFYEALGWSPWRGPLSVATTVGVVPTPGDEGSLYVRSQEPLNLDAPLTCDWREGDVW